jgi:hypothetical protein
MDKNLTMIIMQSIMIVIMIMTIRIQNTIIKREKSE